MQKKITAAQAWQLTLLSRMHSQPGSGPRVITLAATATEPSCAITLAEDGSFRSGQETEPGAADLLEQLLPLCVPANGRLVIAQMGQSLDGRIATPTGVSHYINGPDGIAHLHRLRALVDAVLVGAGTASADNPQLTVRQVPGPNPIRVVLDPNRRVPLSHQLFTDPARPTLRLVNDGKDHSAPGVVDVNLGSSPGPEKLPAKRILEVLARRGLNRILVEGGGLTVSGFLEAGLIDRLHVLVAPLIIGSGRPAFTLPPMDTLETALRPKTRVFNLGTDTLFDLQL